MATTANNDKNNNTANAAEKDSLMEKVTVVAEGAAAKKEEEVEVEVLTLDRNANWFQLAFYTYMNPLIKRANTIGNLL